MPKGVEQCHRELRAGWLKNAFPFSRATFQRIAVDITQERYTSAEAIVKHISAGSGIEPAEFTGLVRDRHPGQLRNEDILEFLDGYRALTGLFYGGFVLAAEGPDPAQELMRQWSLEMDRERHAFLARNIEEASHLVRRDLSCRTLMTRFADRMTRASRRTYFNEGVLTAHDTFMAYSKCREAYVEGEVQ